MSAGPGGCCPSRFTAGTAVQEARKQREDGKHRRQERGVPRGEIECGHQKGPWVSGFVPPIEEIRNAVRQAECKADADCEEEKDHRHPEQPTRRTDLVRAGSRDIAELRDREIVATRRESTTSNFSAAPARQQIAH